jgi:hypothetical protein
VDDLFFCKLQTVEVADYFYSSVVIRFAGFVGENLKGGFHENEFLLFSNFRPALVIF